MGECFSVRKGKWSRMNTVLSMLWFDSHLFKFCFSEDTQETLNCICFFLSLDIYLHHIWYKQCAILINMNMPLITYSSISQCPVNTPYQTDKEKVSVQKKKKVKFTISNSNRFSGERVCSADVSSNFTLIWDVEYAYRVPACHCLNYTVEKFLFAEDAWAWSDLACAHLGQKCCSCSYMGLGPVVTERKLGSEPFSCIKQHFIALFPVCFSSVCIAEGMVFCFADLRDCQPNSHVTKLHWFHWRSVAG